MTGEAVLEFDVSGFDRVTVAVVFNDSGDSGGRKDWGGEVVCVRVGGAGLVAELSSATDRWFPADCVAGISARVGSVCLSLEVSSVRTLKDDCWTPLWKPESDVNRLLFACVPMVGAGWNDRRFGTEKSLPEAVPKTVAESFCGSEFRSEFFVRLMAACFSRFSRSRLVDSLNLASNSSSFGLDVE